MASIYRNIYGKCDLPICVCEEVVILLDSSWATKVTSGVPIVYGRVYAINTKVVPTMPYTNQTLWCMPATLPNYTTGCVPATTTTAPTYNACCGCVPTPPAVATTCSMCVYQVEIDTSQFEIDPDTGNPYEPECSDFVELAPYKALFKTIIDALP